MRILTGSELRRGSEEGAPGTAVRGKIKFIFFSGRQVLTKAALRMFISRIQIIYFLHC